MTAQPRPALRRAEDAEIHPALAVVPAHEAPVLRSRLATSPDAGLPPAGKNGKGSKSRGSKKKKGKQSKPFQGAGRSTSDTLRDPGGAKPVDLKVKVPKSVRKDIRLIAKRSGSTPDELVTEILNGWLGDPRRW